MEIYSGEGVSILIKKILIKILIKKSYFINIFVRVCALCYLERQQLVLSERSSNFGKIL